MIANNEIFEVIYPDPVHEDVVLEKNVYAEMRDGIKLAMDLYKPARGKGPWPAIIGYAGYRKEYFFESALPRFYCPRGYEKPEGSDLHYSLNSESIGGAS